MDLFTVLIKCLNFRRRNLDSGPVGSPRSHRQGHSHASGQENRPRGLQTLRRARNSRLARQALHQGQGTQVRACPWSPRVSRLQEVNLLDVHRMRSGNKHLQSLVARPYIFCMPELGVKLSVKINRFRY